MRSDDFQAVLQVTSGLHSGALLELGPREYLIGSDETCDIVLRDSGLARRHCRVARGAGGFSLQDLRTQKPQPFAPQAVHCAGAETESVYDIGGVLLSLRQRGGLDPQAGRRRERLQRLYAMAGAGLACVVVGAIVSNATLTRRPASRSEQARSLDAATSSDLLEQVKHALADEKLQVGLEGGRLRIAGTTQALEVKNRIRSLGEDLQGVVAIDDRVAYVPTREHDSPRRAFPVTLRGVMIGHPSYFLTDRGARYYVGGILPDGAEVLAIEASQIRFRVQGRDVVYDLE